MTDQPDLTISGLAEPARLDGTRVAGLAGADDAVAVSDVLDVASIDDAATRVHVESRDGTYSASIPLDEIRRGGVLTVEDGGYRLRVMDGTTLCWNVKDVATLRLTATKEPDSVPERPTH